MIKSKIHPFALISALILVGLSYFPLRFAIQFLGTFSEEPANIFFVLMMFCALFGLTFLGTGLKKIKQVHINHPTVSSRFLSFFKSQELDMRNGGASFYKMKKYGFLTLKWCTIQDKAGHQIRFSNWEVSNFEELREQVEKHFPPNTFKVKNTLFDKITIVAFLLLAIWMVVSALMGIVF